MDAEKGTGAIGARELVVGTTPAGTMNRVMARFAGHVLAMQQDFSTSVRTCLGCGAKTDERGVLPCGH